MPLLAEGIRIHGEKLTEQLKPLHDRLTACFRELKKKVEKQYGVITLVSIPRGLGVYLKHNTSLSHLWVSVTCLWQGVCLQPPSLTERKQSRSGSVVLPYIMSSTLRRLSVTSVASSVVSTSSTSSDSASSRPGSDGWVSAFTYDFWEWGICLCQSEIVLKWDLPRTQ